MTLKRTLLLFVAFSACLSVQAQQMFRLSEADLSKAYQEYATITAGRTVSGEPAAIQGKTYSDVIGTHAPGIIQVNLHGQAQRFWAAIAVPETKTGYPDQTSIPLTNGTKIHYRTSGETKTFIGLEGTDGKIGPGSVTFIIQGDGKELYRSETITAGEAPKQVDISLKDIRTLELTVDPGADGPSGDQALWIEPVIEYEGNTPVMIEIGSMGDGPEMKAEVRNSLQRKIDRLPVMETPFAVTPYDWLIDPRPSQSGVYATPDRKGIILANDMVAREFRIFPNLATANLINRMTGESLLRAVSSEGSVTVDGKRWELGGLSGQPERGYLKPEWFELLKTMPNSFLVEDFEITPAPEEIKWKRNRWALNEEAPTGTVLTFTLRGEGELQDVSVRISYTAYDHIPVIRKQFELRNSSPLPINIDAFQLEYLAFADVESPGSGDPTRFVMPNIHIESDYACGGEFMEPQTDITERWVTDPAYTSQRNYMLETLCILEVAPPLGPDYTLPSGDRFQSFSVYEMPFDSEDRERTGLFKRRFHRTVAPWATQNPIFMHLTSSNPEVIRQAVDQCDSTGYEMIIISFGSGLNAEDTTARNIAKWKSLVDYANGKGIEMGCYSLLSSRWISDEVDVINPETGKRGGMRFGSAPCLASEWGYEYFDKIRTFFERTGMSCFEHDGSYPGDVCASTTHTHHKGLNDSQWEQFYKITALYREMCENGVYINVPDFYFLNGSTKTGIGYRETNWSLPRDRQLIHARQLNYDGTWDRMASACWSFVPLVEYQGGGAAATLEPLSEHLYEYRTHMIQNYGSGVQACYRGPRLYDTPETKAAVQEVIAWYKKYRRILNSDMIHLRRPDAQEWDGFLHVNPDENEKGLAMFFNPTDREMTRTIRVPLYYTGLTETAQIREGEGKTKSYKLNRDYSVELTVTIPPGGYTWYVIEK